MRKYLTLYDKFEDNRTQILLYRTYVELSYLQKQVFSTLNKDLHESVAIVAKSTE